MNLNLPWSCGRVLRAASVLAVAAIVAGCPDPDGSFKEFGERQAKATPPDVEGPGCGDVDPTAACEPPAPGESEGAFFFSLSAKVNPKKPIVFVATVDTPDKGGAAQLHMVFQALAGSDRKSPVGDPFDVGTYPIGADGKFEAALPTLQVPGDANPISGSDLEATVTLTGTFCKGASFVCGDISGNATKPFAIDLTGSTFTMQLLEEEGKYPDPLLDCECAPANKI